MLDSRCVSGKGCLPDTAMGDAHSRMQQQWPDQAGVFQRCGISKEALLVLSAKTEQWLPILFSMPKVFLKGKNIHLLLTPESRCIFSIHASIHFRQFIKCNLRVLRNEIAFPIWYHENKIFLYSLSLYPGKQRDLCKRRKHHKPWARQSNTCTAHPPDRRYPSRICRVRTEFS